MNIRLTDTAIQCEADKAGSQEYTVERGGNTYTVTAFSQRDAEETVAHYIAGEIEAAKEETESLI